MALSVLHAGLLQVAQLGLGELLVATVLEGELDGVVAVRGHRADLRHGAGPGQDDGDGDEVAVAVEHLGHAYLLADDACHAATA